MQTEKHSTLTTKQVNMKDKCIDNVKGNTHIGKQGGTEREILGSKQKKKEDKNKH